MILTEFEQIVGGTTLALIADTQHGHIAQEVDGTYFYLLDLHTEASLEVGNELLATLWGDEFDAVVLHKLGGARLQMVLTEPYGEDHDQVGEDDLEERDIDGDRVDQCQGDDDEEIGHLAYRHSIRTIAHDGEDAEEADTHTHGRLTLQILQDEDHEEHDEEDGDGDEHKREVEVATAALTVVQTVDDDADDHDVDDQSAPIAAASGDSDFMVSCGLRMAPWWLRPPRP